MCKNQKFLENQVIDVTICTLNSEHKLKDCLESIIKNIPIRKIIIVDGGSKDLTLEIIRSFGSVVELHSHPNCTLGKSREIAFSHVKTEWFLQLDSDVVLSSEIRPAILQTVEAGDVVEFGSVSHHEITYPSVADLVSKSFQRRGFFIANLVRTKAVAGISIDVHTMEEEYTRRKILERGGSWLKTHFIVGDHFSRPVRHEGRCATALIRSKPMNDWEHYEHGRIARLTQTSLKSAFRDFITSVIEGANLGAVRTALRGMKNPIRVGINFFKGYLNAMKSVEKCNGGAEKS